MTCPTGRPRTTHPNRSPPTCAPSVPRSGLATHPAVLARAMLLWSTVVGGTSLEVFGQYGPDTLRDPAQAYDQQVRMALAVLRGTLDPP